jgi:16S rRNA processing protein RimM
VAGSSQKILLGVFGAPHGIRGEVRLKSFTADPAAIATYGPLQDERGARSFTIEALRPIGKDMFVARVQDIADRSAAEALNGMRLFAAREALPAPEEDQFYHADLIGLRVENHHGEILGSVVAVHNFGAGDIIEIAPPYDTGAKTTAMVTFSRAFVPIVDIAGGRIVVVNDPFTAEETSN